MNNVPNLRFKEFSGDWEKKRFSKYIKLYRGSSPRPIQSYLTSGEGVNWIKIGDAKDVNNYILDKVSEKITFEGSLKSRKVDIGELILANSMSFGATYMLGIQGCIYDGWFVLREYEPYFNKLFLLQQLNSDFLQKQYKKLSTGGVVQNISSDIVYSTKLCCPSLQEQEKIASFFSLIDKKIELQTEKVEELKNYKKGIMQKIFSQELRFKDENGNEYTDWEERKLRECLTSRVQKQVPSKDAPLMAFTAKGGIESKGEKYDRSFLVKDEAKKYKRTEFNDFIYSSNNLDVGSMGLNKYGTAVISDVYEIFQVKDNVLPDIINLILHKPDVLNKVLKYRQGALYGQYRIHADDFLSVSVKVPCYREQEKIALFLQLVDKSIDIHIKKLDLLTDYKKGLLQQMFI